MRPLFPCLLSLTLLAIICAPLPSPAGTKTRAVRQDAELVVHTAALGLGGILENVQERQDQILMIREFVTPIRFFPDDSGYFYVFDMDGVCIAHAAQRYREGQNMFNHKDAKGLPIVQKLVEAARKGGGFVEYNWDKPGSDGLFEKLGYVEPIPGTNFFIGSGIYFPEPW